MDTITYVKPLPSWAVVEVSTPVAPAWMRQWEEALREAVHIPYTPTCHHCWHSPRVWQGPLPAPRHCCWCGVTEGPQHGPYAEGR